uniref:BTB domain-containing protein n=1 Tax=Florenciella parvula TaxID=236787 RepID=A0A7S2FDC8_9STRA|eukprot:CAMPEP_0119478744 /NCGR_PEP_ID=MMETSP1344-20130328/8340_1 /TAXON_ID=236787 /ORGANISM="Florenciella parvula, Strain CCMP2471" /LENGTH=226 /DNA_ID=CAMNT_0007512941 /DNA_START=30 /DNA_END=710 /DNA_ORIENTATION=+
MTDTIRLRALWEDLDRQERELKLEQKHLSDIWLKVCDKHKDNDKAREKFDKECRAAGISFVPEETPIRLNVGGQIFETSAGVLCKDRFSILAALCRKDGDARMNPPIPADRGTASSGAFFLDRDWWIFRHILQFLRTDSLPDDPLLLEEMYNEATFYRLGSLRKAIEDRNAASTYYLRERAEATRPTYDETRPVYERSGVNMAGSMGYRSAQLPDPFGFSSIGDAR